MPRTPLCWLALLLACALPAAVGATEHLRFYEVTPSSPSAPIDVGEIASAATPGDTIVVNCFANPPYVMVQSFPPVDPGKLGWTMTGLGVYRLVVPKDKPINVHHEVRFAGKLRKVEEGTGGGGGSDALLDWALKGTVVILGEHEGIGRDAGRKPPAAIPVDTSHATSGVRGAANIDLTTDTFTGSDGGREMGAYLGEITTSRKLTGKELPPTTTGPCPQDGAVDVTFVYKGVDEKDLSIVVDPDNISLDTKPAAIDAIQHDVRRNLLTMKWNSIESGTWVHENGHRDKAYTIAGELAKRLDALRVFGYAVKEPRARQLANIAWAEFQGHVLGEVSDQLAKAQDDYDVLTDHGYNQQPTGH